jgi:regulator of protease activity HflC (stomatin/prohibitin superfamily)
VKGSNNIISWAVFILIVAAAVVVGFATGSALWSLVLVAVLVAVVSPRVIKEWERGVLLRLGKFQRVLDQGVAWVIPGIDGLTRIVDMRIRSTPVQAQDALTLDTVPVNVDAVLFWRVTDAKKAVLEVEDFPSTVSWAAQTTLRDLIGRTELLRMISDREALDKELREIIDRKTSSWGITVQSVEIRDVMIPKTLEDAMSRKAQAERERESRIILAESEPQIAERLSRAAQIYEGDPDAMRLRAMNITYESIKESGGMMVVPSGMADSINPGVLGLAAAGLLDLPVGDGDGEGSNGDDEGSKDGSIRGRVAQSS